MIHNNIPILLEQKNITFKIHRHQPVLTMEDVENNLGFAKEGLLKTLVFTYGLDEWVFVVLEGKKKLDYRTLANVLSVARDKIKSASPEQIEEKFGFQVGGISPISIVPVNRVFFDKSLEQFEKVYCGAGSNDQTLEIKYQDLLVVSGGKEVAISKV